MTDRAAEIADRYISIDGSEPKPARGDKPSKGKHAKRKARVPTGPSYPPLEGEARKALIGAPSSYKPIFATQLIADHADGYSLSGFAAKVGVARNTLTDWMVAHPEFDSAYARARAARARWFEQRFLAACESGGIGSQGNLLVFGLINAAPEDYKQKQEVNHTGQLTLADLIDQSMKLVNPPTIEHVPDSHKDKPGNTE